MVDQVWEQGTKVYDGVDISNPVNTLSLTTTAAQTDALPYGVYDIWASADCFILTGTDVSGVTTSGAGIGRRLLSTDTLPNIVIVNNKKLGGIVASGNATLYYQKVG